MTTYFVTRHAGALEWAARQGIKAQTVTHLDTHNVKPGDTVIGTLPVNLIAEINAKGASYLHLVINVPEKDRGRNLTADEMENFGAVLEGYRAERVK
jgi:CRISPR-associated protein Csx16